VGAAAKDYGKNEGTAAHLIARLMLAFSGLAPMMPFARGPTQGEAHETEWNRESNRFPHRILRNGAGADNAASAGRSG
jgi:hypothetical protein